MRAPALLALATLAFFSSPCRALEKTSHLFNDAEGLEWRSACEAAIFYYNVCNAWTWAWSGFEPGERVGVTFGPVVPLCDVSARLVETAVFTSDTVPAGYGFTGTISIHPTDQNLCPIDPPLASQAFLPGGFFSIHEWSVLLSESPRFAVVVSLPDTPENPLTLVSDHPAAGPTGPAACGVCYPSNRPIHSFRYGTVSAPLCPGVPFDDGTCRAELVWQATGYYKLSTPVAAGDGVDTATWGSIKSLYR